MASNWRIFVSRNFFYLDLMRGAKKNLDEKVEKNSGKKCFPVKRPEKLRLQDLVATIVTGSLVEVQKGSRIILQAPFLIPS